METWIDLGGLTVRSPVTAATNLMLSIQCMLYFRRRRSGLPDRSGYWSLFFLAMSAATLAGVFKHGFAHALPGGVYELVLWIAAVGSAASVHYAQLAALGGPARSGSSRGRWLRKVSVAQAAVFFCGCVAFGPEMWLVVLNTAVGLVPVIVAESRAWRRGSKRNAWVVGGLSASLLTGVVYVGNLSMGIWFNHVDLAHVLMGVSFWLIVRGSSSPLPRTGQSPLSEGYADPSDVLTISLRGRA